MLVGSRGNFCTGTAIARDLVLTAAHCVLPGADYKLVELGADKTSRILRTSPASRAIRSSISRPCWRTAPPPTSR